MACVTMVTLPSAAVEVGDRERNALAVFVDADDDELSGLRRACHARCEDLHQPDALCEESFFKYRVHYYIFSGCCPVRKPHCVVTLR